MHVKFLLLITLLLWGNIAVSAQSTPGRPSARKEKYSLELKNRQNQTEADKQIVRMPGAAWLRLHIGEYQLGEGSYITITSLQDKNRQRLDSRSLPEWGNATAFFNGEAVEVALYLLPGEKEGFVRFREVTVGEPKGGGTVREQSLCGTDNRVASADPRVARINVLNTAGNFSNPTCTAWLISNGAVLTAGHCVGQAGVTDTDFTTGVIEFNVPLSTVTTDTVFSHPNDQYPILANTLRWRFDGSGKGFGKDWAVFTCGRNPNTGRSAHEAQGAFFRLTNATPTLGDTITITGYGVDTGTQNQTLQTASGPYQGESQSGSNFWHRHRVDTMPANSGSPIIRDLTGLAVGIHTNGGCSSSGGENAGTSFNHADLAQAVQDVPGIGTVYVDKAHPAATKDGNIFRPLASVAAGVNAVTAGATVSIVAGTYADHLTISKPMTLRAPVGTVTIGQ